MKKNVFILLTLIMMLLLVFGCSLDQTGSGTSEKSTDQGQVQSSDDNGKALLLRTYRGTLVKIIHAYRLDYIEVSPSPDGTVKDTVIFTVTENTKITLNGRKVKLDDLQKGDSLIVTYIDNLEKAAININAKRVITK